MPDSIPPFVQITAQQAAQQLRADSAAVRISFTWIGTRKRFSQEQTSQAAEVFGAEPDAISNSKAVLDTKHPVWKALTKVRGNIRKYWEAQTLPFPEPGIRLIRKDRTPEFDAKMHEFRGELQKAAQAFQEAFSEVIANRQEALGDLFCEGDYPSSAQVSSLFGVEWDFPSMEPPDYLLTFKPELYEQEAARVQARFDEAISMTQGMLAEEFAKLVAHLQDRLTDGPEGRKIFNKKSLEGFQEFFDKFATLSVRSDSQLDALVKQARDLVGGVDAKEVRTNDELRAAMQTGINALAASVDQHIVTAPRRLIRSAKKKVTLDANTNGAASDDASNATNDTPAPETEDSHAA